MLKHEVNCAITKLEIGAIIDDLDKFFCYLHGKLFNLVADQDAVPRLRNSTN